MNGFNCLENCLVTENGAMSEIKKSKFKNRNETLEFAGPVGASVLLPIQI